MTTSTLRPPPAEHAAYWTPYIQLVPDGDILALLEHGSMAMQHVLMRFGETRARYRYAPDKWSVAEVVGHVCDTERVLAYRALCIARGDRTELPGFDSDDYVAESGAAARALTDLAEELMTVRRATLQLLHGLPDHAWGRCGTVAGGVVSVRALAFIIAGHELHHRKVLEERYLPGAR